MKAKGKYKALERLQIFQTQGLKQQIKKRKPSET